MKKQTQHIFAQMSFYEVCEHALEVRTLLGRMCALWCNDGRKRWPVVVLRTLA